MEPPHRCDMEMGWAKEEPLRFGAARCHPVVPIYLKTRFFTLTHHSHSLSNSSHPSPLQHQPIRHPCFHLSVKYVLLPDSRKPPSVADQHASLCIVALCDALSVLIPDTVLSSVYPAPSCSKPLVSTPVFMKIGSGGPHSCAPHNPVSPQIWL